MRKDRYTQVRFLGSAQPASIHRNVCVYGLDKSCRGCVNNTDPRFYCTSVQQLVDSLSVKRYNWSKQSVCAVHVYALPSAALR